MAGRSRGDSLHLPTVVHTTTLQVVEERRNVVGRATHRLTSRIETPACPRTIQVHRVPAVQGHPRHLRRRAESLGGTALRRAGADQAHHCAPAQRVPDVSHVIKAQACPGSDPGPSVCPTRFDDVEDGSDLRRGQPAAHSLFGVPQTVNSAALAIIDAVSETRKLAWPAATDTLLEELKELHIGQGHDLYWTRHGICPSEDEYLAMVDKSKAPIQPWGPLWGWRP